MTSRAGLMYAADECKLVSHCQQCHADSPFIRRLGISVLLGTSQDGAQSCSRDRRHTTGRLSLVSSPGEISICHMNQLFPYELALRSCIYYEMVSAFSASVKRRDLHVILILNFGILVTAVFELRI